LEKLFVDRHDAICPETCTLPSTALTSSPGLSCAGSFGKLLVMLEAFLGVREIILERAVANRPAVSVAIWSPYKNVEIFEIGAIGEGVLVRDVFIAVAQSRSSSSDEATRISPAGVNHSRRSESRMALP